MAITRFCRYMLAFCVLVLGILLAHHPPVQASQIDNSTPTRIQNPLMTKRRLTVADMIETRLLLSQGPRRSEPVLISSSGRRYLFVMQRGDIARNGSWIEFYSGGTSSLRAASSVTVVKLFTRSTAERQDLAKDIRWLSDDRRISFLWDDGGGVSQVVILDFETKKLTKLTHHKSPIVAYDISGDGRTLIYTAESPKDKSAPSRMRRSGFAVTDESIWTLLDDSGYGLVAEDQYETFIQDARTRSTRKTVEGHFKWSFPPHVLSLSPDGLYAITERPVPMPPRDWDLYTQDTFKRVHLVAARSHPGQANWLQQFAIIDVRNGHVRPLWEAPAFGAVRAVWSPDNRHVVLGPTFLPPKQADAEGLLGRSVAVVEIQTGNFVQLRTGPNNLTFGYAPLRWGRDDIIELGDPLEKVKAAREFFRCNSRKWSRIQENQVQIDSGQRVRIIERQDCNTPPLIVGIEQQSGQEQVILEPDPKLREEFTLGHVEKVHWAASDGKPWTGMLYYPVGYRKGKRFPFVIQTHGYIPNEFSLSGGGLTTVFAAQPLANIGIAVLQVGGPDQEDEGSLATPREVEISQAGFEGAIKYFSEMGLADPDKIGLIGFSRTYWHVAYMLTHSTMPIAAAVIADGIDGGYFQYVLSDAAARAEEEKDLGATPFGDGLSVWIRHAPGFNVANIHTPLRMETDSGPVLSVLDCWELFANLKYLHKPAELYVIPDIQHGAHVLQNPVQRLASEGATVDWFDFWLNSHEDTARPKRGQYIRWERLKQLQ